MVCKKRPMAVCKYDAGRPFPAVGPFFPPEPWLNFHVFQEPAAIWSPPGIMWAKDAELHCGGQRDSSVRLDSGSGDFVPCAFGAMRGLDPFQHIEWALQQVHPHASVQAALEPKLDAVAKLVASKNPAELDEIRAHRLELDQGRCSNSENVAAGLKLHLKL